jgi:hypothetical protein
LEAGKIGEDTKRLLVLKGMLTRVFSPKRECSLGGKWVGVQDYYSSEGSRARVRSRRVAVKAARLEKDWGSGVWSDVVRIE